MKQQVILENIKTKLGIEKLNSMQQEVLEKSTNNGDLIIYSPTGTGKTLAYAITVLKSLKNFTPEKLQAVVLAPSRELAVQIYHVMRDICTEGKVTCVYGGHSVVDEKQSLLVPPTILIATPGRLLDHVKRRHISITNVRQLIIDEFDKCLELGFEDEMKKLSRFMPNLSRRILTSATTLEQVPSYVKMHNTIVLDFLEKENSPQTRLKTFCVKSDNKDKLETLKQLLFSLPHGKIIVFANFREAVGRIYTYLQKHSISSGIYHGALEQIDREKAIAMFNNGSFQVLVATDLGARGLDIDNVQHIIHYHLPLSPESYTHRNGRTARVDAQGNAYVIQGPEEQLPNFVKSNEIYDLEEKKLNSSINSPMATLYFKGGKKEKISRGDIVGFIAGHGGIDAKEIGQIYLSDHYALVAVPASKAQSVLNNIQQHKIKGKKVRISLAKPESE